MYYNSVDKILSVKLDINSKIRKTNVDK